MRFKTVTIRNRPKRIISVSGEHHTIVKIGSCFVILLFLSGHLFSYRLCYIIKKKTEIGKKRYFLIHKV